LFCSRAFETKERKAMQQKTDSGLLASDRGDVPGWVLITLMTAGLVVLIWAYAGPALEGVFQQAMNRVVSF
jgi:hypothetical protein